MPELPEVETIKTAIAKGIGRARIEDVMIRNASLRQMIPADFAARVAGAKITEYRRIAKYIVISLNNGLSIVWHMGMSGKIKLSDDIPAEPAKHDHVIFKTDKGYIVYNDPRRFGLLTYCPTEKLAENPLFAHTGIDPFAGDLSPQYLFSRLQKKKKTPIKLALLDQEIIAGIGNIYASEILYESRILPMRPAGQISPEECGLLIENTRKVLQKAILAGGSTLKDYKKPDGSLGYFQNMHCVYNRTGQRCPDCTCNPEKTGGIKKTILGGRSTFYCERLQK